MKKVHHFLTFAMLVLGSVSEIHAQSGTDITPRIGPVPPSDTIRPPFADEVGALPGSGPAARFAPLPGLPLDTSFDSVCWIQQGPGLTKNGDLNITPDHPTSGGVSAVAPHPTNQNILYIGTVNGGVWKTTNALAATPRWQPLTDDQLSLSIGGLAFDRNDPTGNTLVAGFGRRSSFGGTGGAQRGVIRTTDGGQTWTRLGETDLAGRSIYNLTVRGDVMLLAVPSTDNGSAPGLYASSDGGASFVSFSIGGPLLPAGAVTHLAEDPSNLIRFYAHVAGVGVYRSDLNGGLWTNISAGLPVATSGNLALAVSGTGVVYAATLGGTSQVYRSTNQGVTWVQMDSVVANTSTTFNAFVADPVNPNLVYLSGLFTRTAFPYSGRVVRGDASKSAGTQWTSIASTQALGIGTAPHTDSRAMAFTAGNRLVEGDDGGVYELNIANVGSEGLGTGGGGKWRSLNANLQDSEMHSIAYDPVSRIFIGGGQDIGFQEQVTPGQPGAGMPGWNKTSNGDGGDAAVDLLTSPGQSIRYGSSQFLRGFYRDTYDATGSRISTASPALTFVGGGTPLIPNGGSTNTQFVTPIAMNAVAGGRLIISGASNLYESLDQGGTVRNVDSSGCNQLAKIAYGGRFGGSDVPDVVFYGSGSNVRYRTTAGGAFSGVAFPGGSVQAVTFDPENWKTTYVVGTTSVYIGNDIATNGAFGFTNVTGNLTSVGTFHTVEYLTLPSGNAIMVGTDLGAYIMRTASPGVWKTMGDNLPHAPVFDSHFDPAGQVLAVSTFGRGAWLYDCQLTKTPGQYGETFQAFPEGTASIPFRSGELYSSGFGTAAQVMDDDLRELQLTADGTGSTRTAFRLPDIDPGQAASAFSAKWNATIYGDTFIGLADGFSFNFGTLGGIPAGDFANGTYNNEHGFNVGLTVSVLTWAGATPGYAVKVDGVQVTGGFVSKPPSNWGDFNTTRHLFEVDWRLDTGLTLRVDGVTIFTNLPTPGFIPAAGDRFVFGARTGGLDEEVRLDNLAIFTGGVLTPIQATAPYVFSGENQPNEGAAKAFDGDVNSKWLAQDYTGSIGASFASPNTVRAYTLTSANDLAGRDLAAWDFQTGDDGMKWTQHGAQCGQFFENRLEKRTFVVADPVENTKFRMLISDNHGEAETQLAEFQPWRFTPVQAHFIVTVDADSGAGSLRQALADAEPFEDTLITFAPGLSAGTITLASEIEVPHPDGVTIDASGLSGGITIDGGVGSNRIFFVPFGANLSLAALTLTGGNGTGASSSGAGGAIFNLGTLALDRCALVGNSSTSIGGAIENSGTLTLTRCTLANNNSNFGGALFNYTIAELDHCTLSGNSATANGGGIDNGNGGTNNLTLVNTVVAGNTAGGAGDDVNNFNNTVTRVGANIVQDYTGIPATGSGTISSANPLLAPLDDYGGSTQTLALRLGSPAREASVGSTITSDQRGFPIIGTADIGAYETGTIATHYNAYIWEQLPSSATGPQHDMAIDFDGDGTTNGDEWVALTDAGDASSVLRVLSIRFSDASTLEVTFPTVAGRSYHLEYSTDLASSNGWTFIPGTSVTGSGSVQSILIGPVTGFPKLFLRVLVGP